MGGPSFKENPIRVADVIVLTVFMTFAFLAVTLRVWARRIQRKSLDLSDWCIVAGMVWGLALGLYTLHSYVYGGLGEDITQPGNPQAIQKFVAIQGKSRLVGQTTWAVSTFFIRASVLALYVRVFHTRPFRIAGYITHGFNAVFFVSVVLASCLICRPFAFGWDPSIPGGSCGDQKSLDLYIGIVNLFLDITVVVLPMPVLWRLQMALSRKLVLSGMFGLGITICAITLVRIKYSSQNHGSNAYSIYSLIALFTNLEAHLGLINACLPVLKPVFTKVHSTKASSWLSSVMSGSIPIFVRRSQIGSGWKRTSVSRRNSKYQRPFEQVIPPGSSFGNSDGVQVDLHAVQPSRYTGIRPAPLAPTYTPMRNPPLKSPRPPVPPKSDRSDSRKRYGRFEEEELSMTQGIHVEKTFDVERGDADDTDRQGLVSSTSKKW